MSFIDLPTEIVLLIAEKHPGAFACLRSIDRNIAEYTRPRLEKYKEKFCVKIITKDEEYHQLPNGQKHGAYTSFYPDGAIKEKCSYVDGVRNGPYHLYHANGKLFHNGLFLNGLKNGEYNTFSDDGYPISNELYSKGKLNGETKTYDEFGNVRVSCHYVDGIKHGYYRIFDERGKMKHEFFYSGLNSIF